MPHENLTVKRTGNALHRNLPQFHYVLVNMGNSRIALGRITDLGEGSHGPLSPLVEKRAKIETFALTDIVDPAKLSVRDRAALREPTWNFLLVERGAVKPSFIEQRTAKVTLIQALRLKREQLQEQLRYISSTVYKTPNLSNHSLAIGSITAERPFLLTAGWLREIYFEQFEGKFVCALDEGTVAVCQGEKVQHAQIADKLMGGKDIIGAYISVRSQIDRIEILLDGQSTHYGYPTSKQMANAAKIIADQMRQGHSFASIDITTAKTDGVLVTAKFEVDMKATAVNKARIDQLRQELSNVERRLAPLAMPMIGPQVRLKPKPVTPSILVKNLLAPAPSFAIEVKRSPEPTEPPTLLFNIGSIVQPGLPWLKMQPGQTALELAFASGQALEEKLARKRVPTAA